METPRERALSVLQAERELLTSLFPRDRRSDAWPEREGRIAGAVGALGVIGLLAPEEAELWEAWLASPQDEQPVAGEAARSQAAELLGELLEAVPSSEGAPGRREKLSCFQGALAALRALGAAGPEWEERLSERMGWPSPETVRKRNARFNAGGTEVELVAVLSGPPPVGGMRVLYALRFADGISFAIHGERRPAEWHRWEYGLRDDVGTTYVPGGGGGSELEQRISFRTAPPPEASWVELVGVADTPVRLAL